MKTTLRGAAALVALAFSARSAAAQWNVARYGSASRNQVYTTFGIDPAIVTAVGYARIVPMLGRNWHLGVEGGIVAADFDTHDYRARAQVRTTVVGWRSLQLVGSAAFITRGTENSIYQAFNFGADFTGAAGVYRPGWFVAGEFGFDKAVITHITHSQWYRDNFYADARDGWYLDNGGTFQYGASAGVALGPTELTMRAGWLKTQSFNEAVTPLYASLGLGVQF